MSRASPCIRGSMATTRGQSRSNTAAHWWQGTGPWRKALKHQRMQTGVCGHICRYSSKIIIHVYVRTYADMRELSGLVDGLADLGVQLILGSSRFEMPAVRRREEGELARHEQRGLRDPQLTRNKRCASCCSQDTTSTNPEWMLCMSPPTLVS